MGGGVCCGYYYWDKAVGWYGMNLNEYKDQLRAEILAIGKSNGVRKTCRDAGISHGTWSKIRLGGIVNAETLEKTLSKIKIACKASQKKAH